MFLHYFVFGLCCACTFAAFNCFCSAVVVFHYSLFCVYPHEEETNQRERNLSKLEEEPDEVGVYSTFLPDEVRR